MSLDYQHPRVQVEIGRLTKPHGLGGEVKAHIYSGNVGFFKGFSSFNIEGLGELGVVSSREAGRFLLIFFEGIDSLEKTKKILSKRLFTPRESLGLKEGEFLIEDYKGLDVYEVNQGKTVGKICAYLDVGEGLFEIELLDGKKALIPHNGQYLGKPDFQKNQVHFDDKIGLLKFAL